MLLLRASYDPGNMLIFSSQQCCEIDAAIIPILQIQKLNSKRLNHLTKDTQPGSRKARWLSIRGVPPQAIGRTWSFPVACHCCCCTCFAVSSGPSNGRCSHWGLAGVPLGRASLCLLSPGQSTLSPSGWVSPSPGPKLPGFRWPLSCPSSSWPFPYIGGYSGSCSFPPKIMA